MIAADRRVQARECLTGVGVVGENCVVEDEHLPGEGRGMQEIREKEAAAAASPPWFRVLPSLRGVRQHEGSTPCRSVSGDRRRRNKSSALQVKTSAEALWSLGIGHSGGQIWNTSCRLS